MSRFGPDFGHEDSILPCESSVLSARRAAEGAQSPLEVTVVKGIGAGGQQRWNESQRP